MKTRIKERKKVVYGDNRKGILTDADLNDLTKDQTNAILRGLIDLCTAYGPGEGKDPTTNGNRLYFNELNQIFINAGVGIEKFLKNADWQIKAAAVSTLDDMDALKECSEDENWHVRYAVADYCPFFNNTLWHDPSPEVRGCVAKHCDDKSILSALTSDPDSTVRTIARMNLDELV